MKMGGYTYTCNLHELLRKIMSLKCNCNYQRFEVVFLLVETVKFISTALLITNFLNFLSFFIFLYFSGVFGAFYLVFYTVLALLCALCGAGLMYTLDEHRPTFTMESSLIGINPGIGTIKISNYYN